MQDGRPSSMFKIYFELFLLNQKAIDSNFIGRFEVTCRSKVANIVLIWEPRWPPIWKSTSGVSGERYRAILALLYLDEATEYYTLPLAAEWLRNKPNL